jgi:hypothetical protein
MSIYGSSEPLIRRGQKQHDQGNQFHRVNQTVKRYPGNRVLLEALNEMWRRNGNPQEANRDKEPPRPVLPQQEKPKPEEKRGELKPEANVSRKNAGPSSTPHRQKVPPVNIPRRFRTDPGA